MYIVSLLFSVSVKLCTLCVKIQSSMIRTCPYPAVTATPPLTHPLPELTGDEWQHREPTVGWWHPKPELPPCHSQHLLCKWGTHQNTHHSHCARMKALAVGPPDLPYNRQSTLHTCSAAPFTGHHPAHTEELIHCLAVYQCTH